MRFNLAYLLAFSLIACPALAQNYSVQKAPSHWGVPETTIQPSADPVYIPSEADDADVKLPTSPQNTNTQTNDLDYAVSCAASIQIVSLASPSWGKEAGVINSSNLWLARVFDLAEKNNIKSNKVNDLIKDEMQKQTNDYADNLDKLGDKAFECAANPPQ